jgi:uncharacterized protein YecT (DUF1311 family)
MRRSLAIVAAVVLCGGGVHAQVGRYREQASAAFSREMAREKARDCGYEANNRAVVDCLMKELEASSANYKAYTGALRSMLGIMGADADLVKDFDAGEAAWQKYREAQCRAAFDQFKGGTIAPIDGLSCELMLIRSHMREIEKIYHVSLHN